MLNDRIEKIRQEMDTLIGSNAGYAEVLKVSQELDVLILEYTKNNLLKGEKQ